MPDHPGRDTLSPLFLGPASASGFSGTFPGGVNRPPAAQKAARSNEAAAPPRYSLPAGVPFHTRHYMPVRKSGKIQPMLTFDAGLHLDDGAPLRVRWPVELVK